MDPTRLNHTGQRPRSLGDATTGPKLCIRVFNSRSTVLVVVVVVAVVVVVVVVVDGKPGFSPHCCVCTQTCKSLILPLVSPSGRGFVLWPRRV